MTSPSFRDRLTFDAARGEYRDGAIRYLMLRPDALMGLFAELPEGMRPAALAAFARSVARAGGASARSYQAAGAADPASLLATIAATAPALGWGLWDLRRDGEGLALTVRNSPFAAGAGACGTPVCAPIVGMLRAVGGLVLGDPVAVEETGCAAAGAADCRFTVRRAAPPPATAAAPPR
jgi:predicted hydrocarbon binding protein